PRLAYLYQLSSSRCRRPPSSTLVPYTTLFRSRHLDHQVVERLRLQPRQHRHLRARLDLEHANGVGAADHVPGRLVVGRDVGQRQDRKSTRLNSSHVKISYAVFCLKKKTTLESRLTLSLLKPILDFLTSFSLP